MDEKDKEIVKMILRKKFSTKQMAKKLNLTEVALRKRIKNLEKKKILLGFRAIINCKKVDLTFSFTGIDVKPEKLLKVLEELNKFDEVISIYLASGDHTIIAEILAEDMKKLEEVHNRILRIDGVGRICPAILIEKIK